MLLQRRLPSVGRLPSQSPNRCWRLLRLPCHESLVLFLRLALRRRLSHPRRRLDR